jgi:hypothetical protein
MGWESFPNPFLLIKVKKPEIFLKTFCQFKIISYLCTTIKQIKEIKTMKKYWLLNVAGVGGYSIMVHCEANTIEEALCQAAEADLFEDETDAENAYGEEADEDSIKHFTEYNLVNEL